MARSKIENAFLEILEHRAPNPTRIETFERILQIEAREILVIAKKLHSEGLIYQDTKVNEYTGTKRIYFRLHNPSQYPMRETIKIGSQNLPRLIAHDMATAEDINEVLEALSEYANDLEKRFVQISTEQTKRYWANTITLFGLFLAVFTLIISAIPRFEVPKEWTFSHIFLANTVALLPQFFILLIFVIVLWLMFRKS